MDAFLCLTPRNRPVPKELLENSSRRVDETVLAPATSHNLYITSPTDETVPAIVEKQQPPILSHVEEAVPFSSSKHESGALGHIGEVIPIPFGNLDTLNHLDARLDALVIELESKASSMSKETPRDLATRRDSTNTSGCKSESQVATPSFGSGSTTRGSFRPDHGSSSGVSKVMAVIWEQDQERQERQEQEERMGRQEWRKQNQEQRSVVPKPALKSVVQPGAAGLPAKVQFRPGQTQPEAREENQEQRPASRPGAVQLPANVLFPDYNKDDSMILNLTKSETGFNIRTSNGSPVFKVTGMRASSLDLNDTVLSMAGRHFLTFREQGTLLRTTFSGEDANGREIFKIKCPVTFNRLKAVGSFHNANGVKESLAMTGDYYGRKIDITDKKTGMCVARIRPRQRDGNHKPLVLSLLLVSPNVDCVLMTAMCLEAYKITYSRSGLRRFGNQLPNAL